MSISLESRRLEPSERLEDEKYRQLLELADFPRETLNYLDVFYRFFSSATESSYLTPEEAKIVRESLKELQEGKYETYENADDLIRKIKSDKD